MVVIADTGAIISLIHIGQLGLIEDVFGEYYISEAVWTELNKYDNPNFDRSVLKDIKPKVVQIKSKNHILMVMDLGESESVNLYEELNADYLLIDDSKARIVAESLEINCIGTLGLILKAKQKGLIKELRPIFEKFLLVGRYFSKKLLNDILTKFGESPLTSRKH